MIATRSCKFIRHATARPPVLKSAFTLIELLVVVAIIAMLAAILYPSFEQARENSQRATCQSNEKQIGLAFTQYFQDFDERPPCGANYYAGAPDAQTWTIGEGWLGQVYSYVGNGGAVFTCPDDVLKETYPVIAVSYAYNPNAILGPKNVKVAGGGSDTLSTLQGPSTTILLTEVTSVAVTAGTGQNDAIMNGLNCNNGWWSSNNGGAYADTGPLGNTGVIPGVTVGGGGGPGLDPWFPTGRHFGGSNFLFFDGHVKWLQGSAVSPGLNAATPKSVQAATPTTTNSTAAGTQGTFTSTAPVAATYSIT